MAKLIQQREPVQGVEILETVQDKPSNVRKILYRLEDARVAEYQKDTDKTGWETFLWRLTLHEVKHQINKERRRLMLQLNEQLRTEKENSFYICGDSHQRVIFEEALKAEFKCPTCAKPMSVTDNEVRIKALESAVRDLEAITE